MNLMNFIEKNNIVFFINDEDQERPRIFSVEDIDYKTGWCNLSCFDKPWYRLFNVHVKNLDRFFKI